MKKAIVIPLALGMLLLSSFEIRSAHCGPGSGGGQGPDYHCNWYRNGSASPANIHGGGWFYEGYAKNNFAIHVLGNTTKIHIDYKDDADGFSFRGYCAVVCCLISSDTALVAGYGTIDNIGEHWFNLIINDSCEPGRCDVFNITIFLGPDDTYSLFDRSFGTLEGGNIDVW